MSEAPADEASSPLIELRQARLGYGATTLLESIDLQVERGDFLAIVGPNGAGKTTLLRAILGILTPQSGEARCRGRTGYSPQRSVLDPIFPFTVEEVVEMGLWSPGSTRRSRAERQQRCEHALERCGMVAHRRHFFRDLSGGQKQRALVARALVSEPEVLILDEPTNDLDLRGEAEVMELVRSLHESGRTVVMVTHLLHLVTRYARSLALLSQGRLSAGPLDEMLQEERLQAMYGIPVQVVETEVGRSVVARRSP